MVPWQEQMKHAVVVAATALLGALLLSVGSFWQGYIRGRERGYAEGHKAGYKELSDAICEALAGHEPFEAHDITERRPVEGCRESVQRLNKRRETGLAGATGSPE